MNSLMKKVLGLMLFSITMLIFTPSLANSNSEIPNEGEDYLAFAEEMPSPQGGLPAIYKRIVYPEIAQKAGVQGKVYLLVFVDENGGVNDVKVIKPLGGGCDEAAIDAIKNSKFTPGKNKGQAVKVKLSLAIEFKLA